MTDFGSELALVETFEGRVILFAIADPNPAPTDILRTVPEPQRRPDPAPGKDGLIPVASVARMHGAAR